MKRKCFGEDDFVVGIRLNSSVYDTWKRKGTSLKALADQPDLSLKTSTAAGCLVGVFERHLHQVELQKQSSAFVLFAFCNDNITDIVSQKSSQLQHRHT